MKLELEEIKHIRKKLGLTQTDLANAAGVSQSLIAKIESNNIDPTYSNASKIFETLQRLTHKEEKKAIDIMQKKLVFLNPGDDIKSAIAKMKKFSISQLPVIDGKTVVGYISESSILDAIVNGVGKIVEDVMEDVPPIVSKDASIIIISNLLKFYPMVLVNERGKPIGIITKSDIIAASIY